MFALHLVRVRVDIVEPNVRCVFRLSGEITSFLYFSGTTHLTKLLLREFRNLKVKVFFFFDVFNHVKGFLFLKENNGYTTSEDNVLRNL